MLINADFVSRDDPYPVPMVTRDHAIQPAYSTDPCYSAIHPSDQTLSAGLQ